MICRLASNRFEVVPLSSTWRSGRITFAPLENAHLHFHRSGQLAF